MPGGAISKSIIIVEPVVVIPDIASKKASVKLKFSWENANGSEANAVKTTQLKVVSIKACLTVRDAPPALLVNDNETPIKSVTPDATAKTSQSGWLTKRSANTGISIITANVDNNIPRIKRIGRKSIKIRNPYFKLPVLACQNNYRSNRLKNILIKCSCL